MVDADGHKLEGGHRYSIRLAPGQLPPVNAFWSLTMYERPASLLVSNPLDRYLLNSTMLDEFMRDEDGGIPFNVQHDSPGKDREANWLPALEGPENAVEHEMEDWSNCGAVVIADGGSTLEGSKLYSYTILILH